MGSRALITGVGLVTPLGDSVEQTWSALLAGQYIRDHAPLPDTQVGDTGFQPVPAISRNDSAGEIASLARPERPCHERRIFHHARRAAMEAISQARWSRPHLDDPGTALVVGTSKGPVETWMTAPPGRRNIGRCVSVTDGCFGLGELAAELSRALGLGMGPKCTLSAACASGIHALIHAVLLLRSGVATRALVVAAEASVHPIFVGSFKRLGVLPAEGIGCRPFDRDRDGFLMSEAAAAVCIETNESARGIATIDQFALAGDAHHLTGGDPDGRTLKAILSKTIGSRGVDLVHAHATGTPLADPIELRAIECCTDRLEAAPAVWSHKGALGHSLGAAGLVSVVLNCMAHATGTVPPNARTCNPIPSRRIQFHRDVIRRPIQRSVALASGFGGATGAVSLVKAD